jgi:hypothetical protein
VKAVLIALAFVLGLAVHSCAAQPPYGRARLAALSLEVPDGYCSGTAVGRYTVLTAFHCVPNGAMAIAIDGKQCAVYKIVRDGRDHALLTIGSECPQRHIAKLAKHPVIAGDAVFCWGNPGKFKDLLRTAVVAGAIKLDNETADELRAPRGSVSQMVVGNFGKGDSGAGVFNRRGELVGVVSWGSMYDTFPPHLFTGMLPLNFRAEVWPEQ